MKPLVTALILLSAFGCKRTDTHSDNTAEKVAPPVQNTASQVEPQQSRLPEPEDVVDPSTITWSTQKIDDLGLEIPQIEGLKLLELPMGGARSWQQHKKPIATAVWAGAGRTVDAWRERVGTTPGTKMGEPTKVTVCGRPGIKQQAHLEGRMVLVGGIAAGKEELKAMVGQESMGDKPSRPRSEYKEINGKRYWQLPARTTVVLGFVNKGTPIVATWTVEGDNRDAFAAAEKHFFDSIRCD